MSALVYYLLYMVSRASLEKLFEILNISAEADFDDKADESRM